VRIGVGGKKERRKGGSVKISTSWHLWEREGLLAFTLILRFKHPKNRKVGVQAREGGGEFHNTGYLMSRSRRT